MKSQNFVRPAFFCVVVALPLTAAYSIYQVHHASLVLSHYFKGRAGNCSLAESFESEALSRLQLENVNFIRAASKVIRSDERFSLWSTPAGEYWMPTASGDALIYDLAEQKRDIYGRRIHSGDIVLDAGANVGVFTRKALWAGASKIIAIEPGPENLECLRRNFAAEIADGRVVLYPKGIWDKDDVLRLSVDPVSSARDSFVRPIENAQYVEVPLTTVDKLVAELHLPRVDFIKMDIEGAEQKALHGARGTIAKFRPRMSLCIYHVKGDEIMVPKLVTDVRPDYQVSKTCFCAADRVQPEVAFFY
jgi:FkbM family methyltransferase